MRLVAGEGDQAREAPAGGPPEPRRDLPRRNRSAEFIAKVPFSIQRHSGQPPRSVRGVLPSKHFCWAAVSVPCTE